MSYFDHYITIEYIRCDRSEDYWRNEDEVYLKLNVDGSQISPIGIRKMRPGHHWYLNRTFNFNSAVSISIFDHDIGTDDHLGTHVFDANSGDSYRWYTLDGARYLLDFKVGHHPPPPPPEQAKRIADTIVDNGFWPNISRNRLVYDLKHRIDHPEQTNQRNTPFCGTAAIFYWLAKTDTVTYATLCKSLYETGGFVYRGKLFRPRTHLRLSQVPVMNVADWMMMGTLRDVYNKVFPVHINMYEFAGINWPWEMEEWAEIFFGRNASFRSAFLFGEFERMLDASKALYSGGSAYLLVKANMIRGNGSSIFPDHWVTYLPPLAIDWGDWYRHDSGSIRFGCQSWGREMVLDKGEGAFEDGFWGVVTA